MVRARNGQKGEVMPNCWYSEPSHRVGPAAPVRCKGPVNTYIWGNLAYEICAAHFAIVKRLNKSIRLYKRPAWTKKS